MLSCGALRGLATYVIAAYHRVFCVCTCTWQLFRHSIVATPTMLSCVLCVPQVADCTKPAAEQQSPSVGTDKAAAISASDANGVQLLPG
jgi:hypothetical protein